MNAALLFQLSHLREGSTDVKVIFQAPYCSKCLIRGLFSSQRFLHEIPPRRPSRAGSRRCRARRRPGRPQRAGKPRAVERFEGAPNNEVTRSKTTREKKIVSRSRPQKHWAFQARLQNHCRMIAAFASTGKVAEKVRKQPCRADSIRANSSQARIVLDPDGGKAGRARNVADRGRANSAGTRHQSESDLFGAEMGGGGKENRDHAADGHGPDISHGESESVCDGRALPTRPASTWAQADGFTPSSPSAAATPLP